MLAWVVLTVCDSIFCLCLVVVSACSRFGILLLALVEGLVVKRDEGTGSTLTVALPPRLCLLRLRSTSRPRLKDFPGKGSYKGEAPIPNAVIVTGIVDTNIVTQKKVLLCEVLV